MTAHQIARDDLLRVLEMVAEGEHLLHACRRIGLPYHSVWRRLTADDELRKLYEQACEAFGDARVALVADEIRGPEMDPKRAAVIANHERWVIESKARRGFGKTTRVEHTGANGGPIELASRSEGELAEMLQRQFTVLGVSSMEELVRMFPGKRTPITIDAAPVEVAHEGQA